MTSSRAFPASLLQAPIEERLSYFDKYTVNHIHLETAFKQTLGSIGLHTAPKVVLVAGPTGAGKTTLARVLRRHVLEQNKCRMEQQKDLVPVLYGNAIAPNGASFNWKDFYVRLLNRTAEPLVDRKLLIPRQHPMFADLPAGHASENATGDVLRRTTEECMRRRGTKVLIIDEAHHILMVNDPKRMEFQFESLKSLSIETGATIVLIGTYRLLDIRDQSGQLVRRSEIVHFPRYDGRVGADQKEFNSVLEAFAARMPLPRQPNLKSNTNFFYQKTGGGIGILKEWLSRCLEHCLNQGLDSFDWKFAEQYALSNKALKTIIEEALIGEEKLIDIPLSELDALLTAGLPRVDQPIVEKPKKRSAPVGKRNPTRDPAGEAYA